MQTTSTSCRSERIRKTVRPIRPKPLTPTRIIPFSLYFLSPRERGGVRAFLEAYGPSTNWSPSPCPLPSGERGLFSGGSSFFLGDSSSSVQLRKSFHQLHRAMCVAEAGAVPGDRLADPISHHHRGERVENRRVR